MAGFVYIGPKFGSILRVLKQVFINVYFGAWHQWTLHSKNAVLKTTQVGLKMDKLSDSVVLT